MDHSAPRSLSFLSFYIYCAFFIFSIRQRFHSQNLLSFISFMNLYYTLMCYSLCLPSSFESGIKKKQDTTHEDVMWARAKQAQRPTTMISSRCALFHHNHQHPSLVSSSTFHSLSTRYSRRNGKTHCIIQSFIIPSDMYTFHTNDDDDDFFWLMNAQAMLCVSREQRENFLVQHWRDVVSPFCAHIIMSLKQWAMRCDLNVIIQHTHAVIKGISLLVHVERMPRAGEGVRRREICQPCTLVFTTTTLTT